MSRIPAQEMVDAIHSMIAAKSQWLQTFGRKAKHHKQRPMHEIEAAERYLAVLKQAEGDYQSHARKIAEARDAG